MDGFLHLAIYFVIRSRILVWNCSLLEANHGHFFRLCRFTQKISIFLITWSVVARLSLPVLTNLFCDDSILPQGDLFEARFSCDWNQSSDAFLHRGASVGKKLQRFCTCWLNVVSSFGNRKSGSQNLRLSKKLFMTQFFILVHGMFLIPLCLFLFLLGKYLKSCCLQE